MTRGFDTAPFTRKKGFSDDRNSPAVNPEEDEKNAKITQDNMAVTPRRYVYGYHSIFWAVVLFSLQGVMN